MPDPWSTQSADRLIAYATDLELEVDRLRRQREFVERETVRTVTRVRQACAASSDAAELRAAVSAAVGELSAVVRDLHDTRGYHPAHDQVVAVAVRPLAEQAFRWQQRLTGSSRVELRLDLQPDHLEWFPARLRHILDNLFAHALRHHDPTADGCWVGLHLRTADGRYELRVADNGTGVPDGADRRTHNFRYPPAWVREADLGAGLEVVRRLVEQSDGTFASCPSRDSGSEFVLTLPRYDLLDYLE